VPTLAIAIRRIFFSVIALFINRLSCITPRFAAIGTEALFSSDWAMEYIEDNRKAAEKIGLVLILSVISTVFFDVPYLCSIPVAASYFCFSIIRSRLMFLNRTTAHQQQYSKSSV
jgi:hypothetical protein